MTSLNSLAKLPWVSARAKESKYERAAPIAAAYKQNRVFHAKRFEKLEEQMENAHLDFHKDRLDALVWAIFHAMKTNESQVAPRRFQSWGAC
jgi:phage terminase large subunit-like protein